MPARARPAIQALFAVDAAMADVVRTTREPMVGQIRLAWWRERLQELDKDLPVPAEPRLQAVAASLLPLGISGADAAAPEDAWIAVLATPFPWSAETIVPLADRGSRLFHLAGRVLGCPSEQLDSAGGLWAIMDVARHCSDQRSRALLMEEARRRAKALAEARFERRQRPLTSLAALAARDAARGEPLEAEGTRGRVLAVLKHRTTGRLPKVQLTSTAP